MGDRRFILAGFAVLGLIVIPVTLLFTVSPIMAFLKKDDTRDSYVVYGIVDSDIVVSGIVVSGIVVSGMSDEPADQAVNRSTYSRGN
jgi:hypothetical protein